VTEQGDVRRALIEGEESGSAGPLDMAEIKREARRVALTRALKEGLESGEAENFDIDAWLEERRNNGGKAA
jgi:Arc/MetJ-type ribon-helix-helix transcriptional regulator